MRLFGWSYVLLASVNLLGLIDPFGIVPRPLAGVLLVVLGLPWTLAAAMFPEDLQPVAAALAPALTWIVLGFLCAWQRLKTTLPDQHT